MAALAHSPTGFRRTTTSPIVSPPSRRRGTPASSPLTSPGHTTHRSSPSAHEFDEDAIVLPGGADAAPNRLFRLQVKGGVLQMNIEREKARVRQIEREIKGAAVRLIQLKKAKQHVGGAFAGRYRKNHNARQLSLLENRLNRLRQRHDTLNTKCEDIRRSIDATRLERVQQNSISVMMEKEIAETVARMAEQQTLAEQHLDERQDAEAQTKLLAEEEATDKLLHKHHLAIAQKDIDIMNKHAEEDAHAALAQHAAGDVLDVQANLDNRRAQYETKLNNVQMVIDAHRVEIAELDTKCAEYVNAFAKIMKKLGVPDVESMVAHVIDEEATIYKLFQLVQDLNRQIDLANAEAHDADEKLHKMVAKCDAAFEIRQQKDAAIRQQIAELWQSARATQKQADAKTRSVLHVLSVVKSVHQSCGAVDTYYSMGDKDHQVNKETGEDMTEWIPENDGLTEAVVRRYIANIETRSEYVLRTYLHHMKTQPKHAWSPPHLRARARNVVARLALPTFALGSSTRSLFARQASAKVVDPSIQAVSVAQVEAQVQKRVQTPKMSPSKPTMPTGFPNSHTVPAYEGPAAESSSESDGSDEVPVRGRRAVGGKGVSLGHHVSAWATEPEGTKNGTTPGSVGNGSFGATFGFRVGQGGAVREPLLTRGHTEPTPAARAQLTHQQRRPIGSRSSRDASTTNAGVRKSFKPSHTSHARVQSRRGEVAASRRSHRQRPKSATAASRQHYRRQTQSHASRGAGSRASVVSAASGFRGQNKHVRKPLMGIELFNASRDDVDNGRIALDAPKHGKAGAKRHRQRRNSVFYRGYHQHAITGATPNTTRSGRRLSTSRVTESAIAAAAAAAGMHHVSFGEHEGDREGGGGAGTGPNARRRSIVDAVSSLHRRQSRSTGELAPSQHNNRGLPTSTRTAASTKRRVRPKSASWARNTGRHSNSNNASTSSSFRQPDNGVGFTQRLRSTVSNANKRVL